MRREHGFSIVDSHIGFAQKKAAGLMSMRDAGGGQGGGWGEGGVASNAVQLDIDVQISLDGANTVPKPSP